METAKRIRMRYVETEIEHWNDIPMLSNRFVSAFVYRGQANSEWKISSSLERLINHHYPLRQILIYSLSSFERDMLNEFKWKYPIYEKLNIPKDDEIIEWFAIMQHYGCATRMVDFTYSPYVALFMALDNSEEEYCSIWCLNKIICMDPFSKELQSQTGERHLCSKAECNEYIYNKANEVLLDSIHEGASANLNRRIYLVRPHRINERLNRQQGLFAIPEDGDASFEANMYPLLNNQKAESIPFKDLIEYSYSPEGIFGAIDYALIKINIPKDFKYDITKFLSQVNITAETMYPGLEGLAKSINYQRYETPKLKTDL